MRTLWSSKSMRNSTLFGFVFLLFPLISMSVTSAAPANEVCRGIAVLSSSIGDTVSPEEIVTVAKACRFNLVIIDFAWITHHWPRTSDAAVQLVELLRKEGIETSLMYRPRTLRPEEADIHYLADKQGEIPKSHNDLDFRHEDSVQWGVEWGHKLLRKFPSVSQIIIYNLRGPSTAGEAFLKECRSSWQEVRPNIRIGHVGLGNAYTKAVDQLLPFFTVQRDDHGRVKIARQVREISGLKKDHKRINVAPLLKVDWATQTNNSTSDVAETLDACSAFETGFALWHYEHLFKNPNQYDARVFVEVLGGDWSTVSAQLGEKSDRSDTKTKTVSRNDPRAWVKLLTKESLESNGPQLLLQYDGRKAVLDCGADAMVISYLADRIWGSLDRASVSQNDTSRIFLRFSLQDLNRADLLNKAILTADARKSTIPLAVPMKIGIHNVLAPWQENEIMWNAQPAFSPTPNATGMIPAGNKTMRLDVTRLVRDAVRDGKNELNVVLKVKDAAGDVNNVQVSRTTRPPRLPLPPSEQDFEKLPWPHQSLDATAKQIADINQNVWVINDNPLYQAGEEGSRRYFHGGLDIVLDNGTPIYAMKDGWVRSTASTTVTIADVEDAKAAFGWEYTHLGDIHVHVGQRVQRGTMIGRVDFRGLPHLHLTKVYSRGPHWGNWTYVLYPNAHFTYPDTQPPVISTPFYFFKNESDVKIAPKQSGEIVLSGKVDIVVGMREAGEYAHSRDGGFGDRLGVTRIEYEINPVDSEKSNKVRKSFDFTKLRFMKGYDAAKFNTDLTRRVYKHWKLIEHERLNGNANLSYYVVTNSPPDKAPETLPASLANNSWDTEQVDANGVLQYPNGTYEITVRAFDFPGHHAEKSVLVEVHNE